MSESDSIELLRRAVSEAGRTVALTGAGISVPSGIPPFRGEGGIWERFDDGQFTYGRFQRDPAGFWADRLELQEAMFDGGVEPNVAHEALLALEHLETIITQNTDGLHQEANEMAPKPRSRPTVLELHGNAQQVVCQSCGGQERADPVFTRVADGERPPRCGCGGVYKPDVVLFGESLPEETLERAREATQGCDLCLVIGTSLVVHPAASLPRLGARHGATVGIITLEPTPLDGLAEVVVRGDVVDVLPAVVPGFGDGDGTTGNRA